MIMRGSTRLTFQSRPEVVAHVVSRAAHLGGVVEREGAVHVGRPRVGPALHQNVQRLHLAAHCNRKSHGVNHAILHGFMSNFTGKPKSGSFCWLNNMKQGENWTPLPFSMEAWLDGRQISPRGWETCEH